MNSMSNPASQQNNAAIEQYRRDLQNYADTNVMRILRQAVSIRYKEKPQVKTARVDISQNLLPDARFPFDFTSKSGAAFKEMKNNLNFGGDARFHFHTDYTAFQMLGFKYTNDYEVEEVSLFLMGDADYNYCIFNPDYDMVEYEDSVYDGSSWAVPMFHVFFKNGKHIIGPCCIVECYNKDDKDGSSDKRSICYEMYQWYTSRP